MAKTVYVGMSGGVDSSVSALILQEQGYKVVGVYMKNWSEDLPGMKCPWAEDLADAKRVAVKLGIDFKVWDFEDSYREKVVEYMLDEFRKGNTPNPDIMCNQEIKFKLFYEKAMEEEADFIATGHYARIGRFEHDFSGDGSLRPVVTGEAPSFSVVTSESPREVCSESSSVCLMRAVDENKDQTYFLYRISEEALGHTLFPIGEMMKPEVKKLAEKHGLHNAYKKESMGVCFVGEVGMKDFLKKYVEAEPGEIREIETEKILGYHEGAVFYTIGQRHGLYIAAEVPYYVVKKDIAKNIVYVSKNLNNEELWTKELKLKDLLLRFGAFRSAAARELAREPRGEGRERRGPERSGRALNVLVRLRHRAPLIPAILDGNTLRFEHEVKRPASGQSAVLYDGEICLGGGIIA